MPDDTPRESIEAPDDDTMLKLDYIEKTPKNELIKQNELKPGQTKRNKIQQVAGLGFDHMTIEEAEERIRFNSYETVIGFDRNRKYIGSSKGVHDQASIPREVAKHLRLKGGILTHNHPRNSSFSGVDLQTTSKLNADEIRIISAKYFYSAKPNKTWPSSSKINSDYIKNIQYFVSKYNGEVTEEDWEKVTHDAIRKLSKDNDIIYERKKLK